MIQPRGDVSGGRHLSSAAVHTMPPRATRDKQLFILFSLSASRLYYFYRARNLLGAVLILFSGLEIVAAGHSLCLFVCLSMQIHTRRRRSRKHSQQKRHVFNLRIDWNWLSCFGRAKKTTEDDATWLEACGMKAECFWGLCKSALLIALETEKKLFVFVWLIAGTSGSKRRK